jgi:sulfite reductase alpha subunit-like flavoprotein
MDTHLQEAKRHGFVANLVDLEDFEPDDFLQEQLVVICCSTYVEGEPPDNAQRFFKWLKDRNKVCVGVWVCEWDVD